MRIEHQLRPLDRHLFEAPEFVTDDADALTHRLASTGISVKLRIIDPARAKITVSAIGRKSFPSVPCRARSGARITKKAGANHQEMIWMANQILVSVEVGSIVQRRQPAMAKATDSANQSGPLMAGGMIRSGMRSVWR